MPIIWDFIVPLVFITFFEKFGERIGTWVYVRFELCMYLLGLIFTDLAAKYFSTAQPSLLYTSPFMIIGPYYLAKSRKELDLLKNEGILNNVLADMFITKLLKKMWNSPRKASPSPSNHSATEENKYGLPRSPTKRSSAKDMFLKVPDKF